MPSRFSKEKEKEIIRLYLEEKMNQKEIGKRYGTYNTSIKRVLERNNIPLRDSHWDQRQVNDNPFEDLSSSRVHYWLGYLAADGNINELENQNNCISLNSNLDPEHLEKYRNFLNLKSKVRKYFNQDARVYEYSVAFSNKKVCEYLHGLGITANKSKTLKVYIDLKVPFILGYFDGNGCISHNRLGISTGSIDFAAQLEKFFTEKYNKVPSIYSNKSNTCHTVCYNTKPLIAKVMDDMYNSSPIYLERKYNKFHSLYSSYIG